MVLDGFMRKQRKELGVRAARIKNKGNKEEDSYVG
jgi:hypothetical protein